MAAIATENEVKFIGYSLILHNTTAGNYPVTPGRTVPPSPTVPV